MQAIDLYVRTGASLLRAAIASDGQSLVDIAVEQYGFLSGLFELAQANDLSMEADLPAGLSLVVPAVAPEESGPQPAAVGESVPPPVVVWDGQNILDLVLQNYGGLEELFRLVVDNDLSVTQDLVVGLTVKTQLTTNKVALFLSRNGIVVNTGATMAATLGGDFSDDFSEDFSV